MVRGDLLNFDVISCHGSVRCGWQSVTIFVYKISSCQTAEREDSKFKFSFVDLLVVWKEIITSYGPIIRLLDSVSINQPTAPSVGQEDISEAIPPIQSIFVNLQPL